MQTIEINSKYLQAVFLAAAKADTRYCLNGVHIDNEGQETIIVATDGHRLHALVLPGQSGETSLTIPRQAIELALKLNLITLVIDIAGDDITIAGVIHTKAIGAKFPPWRATVPEKISGEAALLDPKYVSDFQKATKLLGIKDWKDQTIYFNGSSAAVGLCKDQLFTAIIMPRRQEKVGIDSYMPRAWIKARKLDTAA